MYDLLLGNVSILIAAVVAVVAWSEDGYLPGLPMGLLLATIPKPALIPVLIWMIVFRRRAFLSAVGSAAILSAIALVGLGAPAYAALRGPIAIPSFGGAGGAHYRRLAGQVGASARHFRG